MILTVIPHDLISLLAGAAISLFLIVIAMILVFVRALYRWRDRAVCKALESTTTPKQRRA